MDNADAVVAILMGSNSDAPVLEPCFDTLRTFGVAYEAKILSAHRTPREAAEYVVEAEGRGVQVFVAAAGMAAHLAGVVAAHTTRPVIGLPIASGPLGGRDALLSTVMMPAGVPVATVAIGGAVNAALLAVEILALSSPPLRTKLEEHRLAMRKKVLGADAGEDSNAGSEETP